MDKIKEVLGRWLDNLSYPIMIVLALLLGLAPFTPEPHLVETTGMLVRGELTEPIYIFDFFMHSFPSYILLAKIIRDLRLRNRSDEPAMEAE